MPRSLSLYDIRSVYRLLGDVRDLRYEPKRQLSCLVDGMNSMVNGHVGFAIRFKDFHLGPQARIDGWIPGTAVDPRLNRYLEDWSRQHEVWEDPMVVLAGGQGGSVLTTSRSRLIDYRDWTKYAIFEEMVDPTKLHDILITHFRTRQEGCVQGFAWHRLARVDFSDRDLNVARLCMLELYRLYRRGELEPPNSFRELPPRLQELTLCLMGQDGQKQIADRMGLSYHTVRSYCKDLYDRIGVSSRDELTARMRSVGPGRCGPCAETG